jgi:glucuronoarabinoxylan endo-1,4-beta-xylanase
MVQVMHIWLFPQTMRRCCAASAAFACCLLFTGTGTTNAQTAVFHGTVTSDAGSVRNATVTIEEAANPSHSTVVSTDSAGTFRVSLAITAVGPATMPPASFALAQNYPNPFAGSTTIGYELDRPSETRVTVFDVLGRTVHDARLGNQRAGAHSMLWDGTDAAGRRVAPGVYFYRLQAGGDAQVRKMVMSGGMLKRSTPAAIPAGLSRISASAGAQARITSVSFTVRISNTAATMPQITDAVFSNIAVAGDTTMTFAVSALPAAPVATIFADSLQQTIRGFGGANILPWRPAMTGAQCATAFGTGVGQLGFTILRLRIPSTTTPGDFAAQADVAKLAQAAGAQIIFGSPWSPPPAMKTNNDIVAGSLLDTAYASFALHLKGFAEYMASQGVPLYAVSLQNEPDARVTYESCDWTAVQFRTFLRNNAASIGWRIMMPESQNFVRALSDSSLNDPVAAAQIGIVAGHIYGGGLGAYPLAVSKGKEIWMTEHLELDTTWTGVFGTGREIHDCLNSGWHAYIWWYIVRYYGPVGEDGIVTKRGYVMSQFSRFIRPGYRKVACTTTPQRNISLSSYVDTATGKAVLVVLNTASTAIRQNFTFTRSAASGFSVYVTTKTKNCEKGADLPAANGTFTAGLEPSSITTFLSN